MMETINTHTYSLFLPFSADDRDFLPTLKSEKLRLSNRAPMADLDMADDAES